MQHVTNWPLGAARFIKLPRGFFWHTPKPTESMDALTMLLMGLVGIYVMDDRMDREEALAIVHKAAGLPPDVGAEREAEK